MTRENLEFVLQRAVHRIAPEIEFTEIDTSADLREEFDMDSVDFLNLVTALSKELKIEIPESEYEQMRSFDAIVAYLEKKTT